MDERRRIVLEVRDPDSRLEDEFVERSASSVAIESSPAPYSRLHGALSNVTAPSCAHYLVDLPKYSNEHSLRTNAR